MEQSGHGGSPSLGAPDYWWYDVRRELLRVVMAPFLDAPALILDVGSADGPSVDWLGGHGRKIALDVDPRGLADGGVCGSALAIPFVDNCFDVVAAFDVIEHCEPEDVALAEITRVLKPGGALLLSVPAYTWAWSDWDEANGHHRRYTRRRIVRAAEAAGLRVERATYAFAGTFPFFAAERMFRRTKERVSAARGRPTRPADIVQVPATPPAVDRFLRSCSVLDARLLSSRDLPFGSSVFVAARKERTA